MVNNYNKNFLHIYNPLRFILKNDSINNLLAIFFLFTIIKDLKRLSSSNLKASTIKVVRVIIVFMHSVLGFLIMHKLSQFKKYFKIKQIYYQHLNLLLLRKILYCCYISLLSAGIIFYYLEHKKKLYI